MALSQKSIETPFGAARYFRATSGGDRLCCLFVHGLGADKRWFEGQYATHELAFADWIVPDLLGHGTSARPDEVAAYRMQSQAAVLAEVLRAEAVRRVVLIAHSMGGPIALRLTELLGDDRPRLAGLVYAEGNIDEGDAFLSRHVAEQTAEGFARRGWARLVKSLASDASNDSYLQSLRLAGWRTVHASALSLVEHSVPGITVPLLANLRVPKLFLFGEKNRGRFTSEAVARTLGEVCFVPGAGHALYLDNPGAFWDLVRRFCRSL